MNSLSLWDVISLIAFFIVLVPGGTLFCNLVFLLFKIAPNNGEKGKRSNSIVIGYFERIIISIGVFSNHWELLISIIALKTIARFKRLDEQEFAEYFLVGSLASLFWALLCSYVQKYLMVIF